MDQGGGVKEIETKSSSRCRYKDWISQQGHIWWSCCIPGRRCKWEISLFQKNPRVRKILVPAILGPEMAAPILWTPEKKAFFLQENLHVHKILVGGGGFWVGGGRADFIFMGAGIFLTFGEGNNSSWKQMWFGSLRVALSSKRRRGLSKKFEVGPVAQDSWWLNRSNPLSRYRTLLYLLPFNLRFRISQGIAAEWGRVAWDIAARAAVRRAWRHTAVSLR